MNTINNGKCFGITIISLVAISSAVSTLSPAATQQSTDKLPNLEQTVTYLTSRLGYERQERAKQGGYLQTCKVKWDFKTKPGYLLYQERHEYTDRDGDNVWDQANVSVQLSNLDPRSTSPISGGAVGGEWVYPLLRLRTTNDKKLIHCDFVDSNNGGARDADTHEYSFVLIGKDDVYSNTPYINRIGNALQRLIELNGGKISSPEKDPFDTTGGASGASIGAAKR